MVELFIALRHIRKRKFQTIISVIAISLSLVVFTTSLAVSDGLTKNMLNSILTLNPHITLKYLEQEEGDYKKTINSIKNSEVISKTPSIDLRGFIKYNGSSAIPLIRAQDLKKLDVNIVKGEITDKNNILVMGEELRQSLDAKIGDSVSILGLNGKEIKLKIAATFKTGFLAYDSNLVIIPFKIGQIIKENGDRADSIILRVKNARDIKKINKISSDIISNSKQLLYSTNWAEENYNLLSSIKLEKFVLVILLSFLSIIATFVVAVILNISVREKTNDIGILKAFGYSEKNIKRIFIYEGIFVAILGIIISLILTPIVIEGLKIIFVNILESTYYIKGLPVEYNIKSILIIYIFAVLLVFLASIIPARYAAKLDTTDALRFNL